MAYSDLSTVNTSDVANASWANQVKDNFIAVKPRILQPIATVFGGTYAIGTLAHFPSFQLGSSNQTGYALHGFLIPSDFSSIKKAVARVASLETGNFVYSVLSNFAAPGEAYDAHVNATAEVLHTVAISSGIITEIDISTCFPTSGIAANQSMGLRFTRKGASSDDTIETFSLVGPLDIEYNV